ncbi:Phenyloxazoline synthase MbtB [Clostridiales bacterium CHKCI001]|nr:Phenyloxazoline synthase MbtB [Clostridiales bacterium CHKCI001]
MEYRQLKEQVQKELPIQAEFEENDNLLELGLDSLKIMRLVNEWRKQGIRIPYGHLMEQPTLKKWWKLIQKRKKKEIHREVVDKEKNTVEADSVPFLLTDVQYAYKIGRERGQELGNIGCHAYLEFSGKDVNGKKLEQAWNRLQYHHPMLRVKFLDNGLQEIMPKPYSEKIEILDLVNTSDFEEILEKKRRELSHRKLKVEEGQVAALTYCLLPEGKTRILFELDLLVADVQSMQVILRDLATAYTGKELPKESKNWRFDKYLEKQSKDEEEERKQAREYWNKRIPNMPFGPELPLAKETSTLTETRFKRRIVRLQREEWNTLQRKAAENQITPAIMLLSAYAVILERWSSNKKFLINIPFFNRKTEYTGIEEVVADFTTLLLLEVDMEKKTTFKEVVEMVKNQLYQDMKYTSYSGVQVQRDMVQMSGERQIIAPVVFACNLGTPLINNEFKNNIGEFSYMISQTPGIWLDFQTYEDENGVMLTWDSVDELFYEGMMDDMMDSFGRLLHQLSSESWDIYYDVLPERQKKFIEEQKNIENISNPSCLHTNFFKVAKERPEKIAIIDTGINRKISYGELSRKVISIASFLVKHHIQRQPIAISTTRGWHQAAAALGILVSNNIYVPVTINQPEERRKIIHEKTGIHYVITDEQNYNTTVWPQMATIWILEEIISKSHMETLPDVSPEDSAYIIMTSGTTGIPKGAEMSHKGAWNTIEDVNKRVSINSEDIFLGVSALDFDLSVYDMFGAFSVGGTLLMISDENSRDAEYWLQLVERYQVTIWNSVPILLDMLLICAEARNMRLPFKAVLTSGDWIGMDLPERVKKLSSICKFIAMGGATEASIWSNYLEVKLPIPETWHSIPYGRPLSHQTYRVVDEKGVDVPFWVEGELWIGGEGVGTYRGDEKLANEKFIRDAGSIWYRTGDKGRFWSDGTIEFLGRKDFQVKIRGHRIELGEIETALKTIAGIKNAVVEPIKSEDGEQHLVSYIETSPEIKEPLYRIDEKVKGIIEEKWNQLKEIGKIVYKDNEYSKVVQYAERKACNVMLKTLQTIGILLPGMTVTYDSIMQDNRISETQKNTVKLWIKDLLIAEVIKESRNGYILNDDGNINSFDNNSNKQKIDVYMDKLQMQLSNVIQGDKEAEDVFYAENQNLSPNDLLATLPGKEETLEVLAELIGKIVEGKEDEINILEVGTRDLDTTEFLLKSVKGLKVKYTYIDSSAYFVNNIRKLANIYPFFTAEVVNLDSKNMNLESLVKYECVITVNYLHRVESLKNVLQNIKKILSDTGCLAVLEVTESNMMQDVVVAVLERENYKKNILSTSSQWKEEFYQNGYQYIQTYPEQGTMFGRNVFALMSMENAYRLNEKYIRSKIENRLPEYMIPKSYCNIVSMPLNKNGKIDKKKLYTFYSNKLEEKNVILPETEVEKELCKIWKEIFAKNDIGITDNYYSLGGDSLLATRMLTKIKARFSVNFSIADIMGRKTIREQAERIDELKKSDASVKGEVDFTIKADKENENIPFPLTDVQQAYWIGRSGSYDLGKVSTHCYFELEAFDIDIQRLQAAWNDMIKYHGMMRGVVLPSGEQQILKSVPEYKFDVLDLSNDSPETILKSLDKVRQEMSHQVIAAEKWPLFDVRISLLKNKKIRLHISFDNLIFDGWSMFHLLSEWNKRYDGKIKKLTEMEISFRDYVLGLEEMKKSEVYKIDKKYWMDRAAEFSLAPELPLAKKEGDIEEQRFNRRTEYLNKKEWESLKCSAQKYDITPAALLLTAYGETLRRWSLNKNFTLNLTQFNRVPLHPQVNELVGDFTTLTLLEIKNDKEDTFLKRARSVQHQLMQDLEHIQYSAVEFQRELKHIKGVSNSSFMPVVFTSGLGISKWSNGEWIGTPIYNVSQTPQVWLDHQVVEHDGGLGLFWDSVDELFYPGMLDEMFQAYVDLLRRLVEIPKLFEEKSSSLIKVKISEERKVANETAWEFPIETLDGMFLKQAEMNPSKEAVVTTKRRMTYEEIKSEALYVADYLKNNGVKKGDIVAIIMEKGWEQIVAVYGILFSGAAYLPIDVHNPRERIEKILSDSGVRNILVQQEVLRENDWLNKKECLIVLGQRNEGGIQPIQNQPEDLAYVIYTSGSTGVPKGVMITHKGATNTILDINSKYKVNERDSVLALSSLHFDLSVYDVFGILGSGGKIVIPDYSQIKDPEHWIELMNRESVTIWNTVPAFMEMLVSYINGKNVLNTDNLRIVLLSGDWIPVTLHKKIYELFKNVMVLGLGGATEASIWSNVFKIPKQIPQAWVSIPYGKPLLNQKYYILDNHMNNCPDWVPGLLYISGDGVAKGYLNNTKLTDSSFVYWSETGERLYCTGDLGRYWPDGNIEFLGRIDNQIKINGYRVELGEIESALLENRFVISACVVVVKNTIIAIITVKANTIQEEDLLQCLREELHSKLPEYFLPKIIKIWKGLPLTVNNKVNRKQIKNILENSDLFEEEGEEAVIGDMENSIAEVWKDILGLKTISRNDDFFEKGGDSLKAMAVVNELNNKKLSDVKLSLALLFSNSTPKTLAEVLENGKVQSENADMEEGTL